MKIVQRKVVSLRLDNGACPFDNWFESLSSREQRIVDARLSRIRDGNFGDHILICRGIYELRIHFGAGLRIYYGISSDVVILLGGGTKRGQQRDIIKARRLWEAFLNETN